MFILIIREGELGMKMRRGKELLTLYNHPRHIRDAFCQGHAYIRRTTAYYPDLSVDSPPAPPPPVVGSTYSSRKRLKQATLRYHTRTNTSFNCKHRTKPGTVTCTLHRADRPTDTTLPLPFPPKLPTTTNPPPVILGYLHLPYKNQENTTTCTQSCTAKYRPLPPTASYQPYPPPPPPT